MTFKNSSQIQWIVENEDINGSTIPNDPDVSVSPPNRAINDVLNNTIDNQNRITTLENNVAPSSGKLFITTSGTYTIPVGIDLYISGLGAGAAGSSGQSGSGGGSFWVKLSNNQQSTITAVIGKVIASPNTARNTTATINAITYIAGGGDAGGVLAGGVGGVGGFDGGAGKLPTSSGGGSISAASGGGAAGTGSQGLDGRPGVSSGSGLYGLYGLLGGFGGSKYRKDSSEQKAIFKGSDGFDALEYVPSQSERYGAGGSGIGGATSGGSGFVLIEW